MGEVYEAEDLELRGSVALKTLLPEIAGDARSISRFKQEIQLSRKVVHPNVCRVFDLSLHPVDSSSPAPIYFLTMEFLPGETLEARLRREGPMSPSEALPILERVASALDAAHKAAIIHRDFKPSNVMMVPAGGSLRPVVTDFGLARSNAPIDTQALTQSLVSVQGHVMGTPGYIAPELLAGRSATISSDVYALGVTAYRIVAGAVPNGPDVALPGVDGKWTQAIRRALSPDPACRFGSAGEFVQAIRGPASTLRPKAFAFAAAILVLLAGWFGWMRWQEWSAQPSAEAMKLYRSGTDDVHAAAYFAATKALEHAVRLAPHYSLAHARLADAWMELELPEKSGVEMLRARREGTVGLSSFDRLQIDAIDSSITRDFAAAAAKYQQMLRIAGQRKADVYLDLGRTYERAEQIPKALESYVAASEAAPSNPAAWLLRAALDSRAPQQRAQAEEEFRKAEELYQVTSNLEGLTEVAYQRSVDANRRNQFNENAAQALRVLETARITGNVHQEIRAKLQLGSSAFFKGDAALAERYAREAIDTARASHIDSLAIRGVLVLGNAYRRKGDLAGAERHYNDALEMSRHDNTRWLASQALLSLAGLHDRQKRPDDAMREAREALTFYQPNHFARESVQCLTLIGRVQRDRGDPGALDSFRDSLQIAEKAQDSYQMALAHESLGSLLKAQERLPEALAHYQKAMQLGTGAQQIQWAAYSSGETFWMLGRFGEADQMFVKAEANAEDFADLRLSIATSRADMALAKRQYAEAIKGCRRALAGAPPPADAVRLSAILGAAQVGTGDWQQGRRNCELAFLQSQRLADISLRLGAQLAFAEARLESGDPAGALAMIHETEPLVANLPLSHWHVLALAARADRARAQEYAKAAKQQLESVAREWGTETFQVYLARPDVQALWRTVLRLVKSNPR
jgi:tetratricopeptide (TPR) repeat protein